MVGSNTSPLSKGKVIEPYTYKYKSESINCWKFPHRVISAEYAIAGQEYSEYVDLIKVRALRSKLVLALMGGLDRG